MQVARLSDAQLEMEVRQLGGSPEGRTRAELEAAAVAAALARRVRGNGAAPFMSDLGDEESEDDAEEAGLLTQDVASATHHLLRDITPRLRVAVLMGGPGREAPQSLASARTVVDALRTRPHPEQMEQLEAALEEVRAHLARPCHAEYCDGAQQPLLCSFASRHHGPETLHTQCGAVFRRACRARWTECARAASR